MIKSGWCRSFFVKGINVFDTDNQGCTPIMVAAMQGNINVFKVLIENKANVYLKQRD